MATGVASWSTTAANNATADSAVNWAEGQAPSTVNDSSRNEMASVAKWRDDISGSLTTGGTSTAYTLTTNQSFASLTALSGHMLYFKMSATSGASPTLAVDGLTAKPLTVDGSTAVPTGTMLSGSVWGATYNSSANAFLVHAPPTVNPSFTTVTASGAITGGSLVSTGTLAVTGNVTVNTNKFTVTAASGNTVVAGTLDVTGAVTLSSTLSAGASTLSSITGSAIATQSDQETGTSTTTVVSPGRQHFHFGHPKCWLRCDAAGNIVGTAYNITSIADTAAGVVDVTIATDFSDGNWTPIVCGHGNSNVTDTMVDAATPPAAGTCRIRNVNAATSAAADASAYSFVGLGDQA